MMFTWALSSQWSRFRHIMISSHRLMHATWSVSPYYATLNPFLLTIWVVFNRKWEARWNFPKERWRDFFFFFLWGCVSGKWCGKVCIKGEGSRALSIWEGGKREIKFSIEGAHFHREEIGRKGEKAKESTRKSKKKSRNFFLEKVKRGERRNLS